MAAHGHYANLYCNYGPCVHTIPCDFFQKFDQLLVTIVHVQITLIV